MTVVAFLLATCAIAIQIAIGFDGKCGGWLPALGGARPCTVWEYVWSNLSFTWLVILHEYWMVVLALTVAVFTGGALFERFRR